VNLLLWILQIVLALHTVMGAVWKLSHSVESVPSLTALPRGVWRTLSAVELACSAGLMLPIVTPLGFLAPLAALCIAGEMLLFCAVHRRASARRGEVVYWLVVAAIAAFIAFGRLVLKPL